MVYGRRLLIRNSKRCRDEILRRAQAPSEDNHAQLQSRLCLCNVQRPALHGDAGLHEAIKKSVNCVVLYKEQKKRKENSMEITICVSQKKRPLVSL